jgi:hypothetical protein
LFEDDDPAALAARGEQARTQLEQALAATEAAGGGRLDGIDDMDGQLITLIGTFQQGPPAADVTFEDVERDERGRALVVDGDAYAAQDDGTWIDQRARTDEAALLTVAGVPSSMLLWLLERASEPAGIEPIDGAEASYQFTLVGEDVGFGDYDDAPAVADVAVDGEGRVVQVQARVSRISESLPGGSITFDFTYADVPPITAPARSTEPAAVS